MCNNVLEFANAVNQTNNLSTAIALSSVTANMLKALPWYTSWLMLGFNTLLALTPPIERAVWSTTKTGKAFTQFNYVAYGTKGLDSLRTPLSKVMQGLSIALIAVDLGLNIYDSVQKEYTVAQGVTSFALTAAKDVGIFFFTAWLSQFSGAKIGAAIGSPGGPLGMAIGAVIGAVIGFLLDLGLTHLINWIVELIK